MEAPNRRSALAAFARRISNVSRSLEQAARAGRGILDREQLAQLWAVQFETFRLAKALGLDAD